MSRFDPRAKILLAFFFLYSTYALISTLLGLALILIVSILLAWISRGGWKIYGRAIKFLLFMSILVVLLQGVFYEGVTTLPILGKSPLEEKNLGLFTLQGVERGSLLALRFTSVSIAFLAIVLTTRPEDIAVALYKLGIPFKYSYLSTIVLRYLPVMEREVREIMEAQSSRGHEMERGGLIQKFRNLLPLVVPVTISIFRRSSDVAIALDMRGYASSARRTFLRDVTMNRSDYVLIILVIAVTLLLVWSRLNTNSI